MINVTVKIGEKERIFIVVGAEKDGAGGLGRGVSGGQLQLQRRGETKYKMGGNIYYWRWC